jgi:hypothetical protein
MQVLALQMYILIAKNETMYSYQNARYWLGISKPDDYARSVEDFVRYKDRFLP